MTSRAQPVLAHHDALAALEIVRRAVEAKGRAAAVAIADAHGELVAFVRCDGALIASGTLAINKAFTAARLAKPSPSAIGASADMPVQPRRRESHSAPAPARGIRIL